MKKIIFSIGLMLATATAFATTQTKATQDKPWRVYLLSDVQNKNATTHYKDEVYENANGDYIADDDDGTSENQTWVNYNHFWLDGIGGVGGEYNNWQNDYWDYQGNHYGSAGGMTGNITWDETGYGEEIGVNNDGTTITGFTNSSTVWGRIGNEHCNVSDPVNKTWDNDYSAWDDDNDRGSQHDTYTRTADTTWHVQTGGKAIPGRQNLWQFNGSVWEILDKRAVPQFSGASMREVTNKTQIAIGSLGNLKADGNLWLTLPDDTEKDITPTVGGKDFFTFSVGGQKYPLTILANGNDLSVTNPEFCVGQQVNFTFDGLPIGSISNMVGNWSLPTKYVNEQWQHLQWVVTEPISGAGYWQPYGSVNYRINSSLLENTNQTSCWFVNGNGGHVTVSLNLQLPNGQFVSVAANGDFSIFRPSVSSFVPDNPISVVLDTNSLPSIYLGLGDAGGGGGGMGWSLDVHWKTNCNGTFFFTQLIDREWSWDIATFHLPRSRSTGGFWLDNGNPYTAASIFDTSVLRNPKYVATLSFGDGPSLTDSFYSFADLNDSFNTYLEFQPPGGIPVTIGRITWGWHGQTAVSGGIWSLARGDVTGPSLNSADDTFPEWTTVYYNSN